MDTLDHVESGRTEVNGCVFIRCACGRWREDEGPCRVVQARAECDAAIKLAADLYHDAAKQALDQREKDLAMADALSEVDEREMQRQIAAQKEAAA